MIREIISASLFILSQVFSWVIVWYLERSNRRRSDKYRDLCRMYNNLAAEANKHNTNRKAVEELNADLLLHEVIFGE